MEAARILIAAEQGVAQEVKDGVSDEGHQVLTARDGSEALRLCRRHRPDLIVLDVAIPRLDGLEVCRVLRRDPELAAAFILFLARGASVEERVKCLEEGGDDCLGRPFAPEELKARVRALLRRRRKVKAGDGDESTLLTAGSLALDLRTRQARVGKKKVQLTPMEFGLLRHLLSHPQQVFSSEQLVEQVWDYPARSGDSSLVRWHIRNLRSKIEPDPAAPTYLRTLPHHGYLLTSGAWE